MITLKQAMAACDIRNDEVIRLKWTGNPEPVFCMMGQEVRNRFDMKRTLVKTIKPAFCCGEYDGWLFWLHGKGPK